MSVHVREWRDRIINRAYEGQRELTRLVNEFAGSGIPMPETLAGLTPEYVEIMVERGRAAYNGGNTFLPSAIKESNNVEFDKVLEKYRPIANSIQCILSENPYTIRESGEGIVFDAKEVADAANEKSTFIVEGETLEYYHILQSVTDAMNKARAWEQEHGFINFVGTDTTYFGFDGQVYPHGWASGMFDTERKVFGVVPERYVEWILHGAVGKHGEG